MPFKKSRKEVVHLFRIPSKSLIDFEKLKFFEQKGGLRKQKKENPLCLHFKRLPYLFI